MTLFEKQVTFTFLLAQLINYAYAHGYELTLSEAYRTPEQAAINAKTGKGIKNSLHTVRLAIDLNLFKDNKYLTKTEEYKELGVYWESLSDDGYKCCWGGRFNDGNHFSIEHNGVK